ncbi:MAG: hypothetical protein ACJ779_08240 [Chloroflexota bacterium]
MAATVSFVPNDPLASGGPPVRSVSAGNYPPGDIAKFDVQPSAKPGTYDPLTPEFDYWQTKLALIGGLRTWKTLTGSFLGRWWGDQQALPVLTDAGDDLNAFYNRSSLQFFSHGYGGVTVHSAESVDVVVHEQGHALLDAIRSDFFDVPFIEVGALHEAFGDCNAILNAFEDRATREAVIVASPDLSGNQFVESLAEQLGDAIRREYGPDSVETGALRHALNTFRWVDPTGLPSWAPADQLAGEVHSFARVFVGAFYDTIRNIYASGASGQANLRNASRTAGKLLVAAVRTVPAAPDTFSGVGQRMVQADITGNAGVNAKAVTDAFEAHGMTLAAPVTSLPVPLGPRKRRGATGELRERLGVPQGTRVDVHEVDSDTHGTIGHVTAYRPVPLDAEGLQGVNIMVPGVARVQLARRGGDITGVLGEVSPATGDAERQARAFARTLVAAGDIRVSTRVTRARRIAPPPAVAPPKRTASHEIRVVAGEPTVVRVGFSSRR